MIARREELQEQWNIADQTGDASVTRIQVGNATGLITSVEPASKIVTQIVEEAEAILRNRPQMLFKV